MAMFIFAKAILGGTPIKLFNHGNMRRDFTYIDDVREAVVRLIDRPPQANAEWSGDKPDPATSAAPWKIYNIGSNRSEELMHVVSLLEKEFGRAAIKEMLPMQPGDVPATYADIEDLARAVGFRPATAIEDGIGLQNGFASITGSNKKDPNYLLVRESRCGLPASRPPGFALRGFKKFLVNLVLATPQAFSL
jgi:nucleoside-diphosphate-sugar epimerase